MTMHFPTVPVEAVRRNSFLLPLESPRPLILVVDDEPIITQTLAAILEANGYAVLTAQDPAEALELSALSPPELLITDVSMPVMNGFELAVEMRRIAQDCEVIFFTGHLNLAEVCTEIGEMGKSCVMLVKPVHPAALLDQVHEVLRRRGQVKDDAGYARSQILYELLSAVVRGEEANPTAAWKLISRQRQRPAEAVA